MFTSSKLHAKEFTFDKSLYKIDYLPKTAELKRKYFQFHSSSMLFSISFLDCGFRGLKFNNTLPYQNEGGGNSVLLEFCHSSLPLCKNHKKPEVDKISSMRNTYTDRGLCIFLVKMLKTVSISFINSKLVRTLYSVWLLSNLQWEQ